MIYFDDRSRARIRSLVHDYSGIVLERVAIRQLDRKLEEQMQLFGAESSLAYIRLLEEYSLNSKAMDELIAELTVTESFFFPKPWTV